MPNLPISFGFHRGRPCVKFHADGLPDDETLTCLIDFGTYDYELLLYQHAIQRVVVGGVGPFRAVTFVDGFSCSVQNLYVTIDRWGFKGGIRTHILPAVASRDIDGFVGQGFFWQRAIAINFIGDGHTTVRAESAAQSQQSEVEKLHAKIGQLVVERDFLSKAFKS